MILKKYNYQEKLTFVQSTGLGKNQYSFLLSNQGANEGPSVVEPKSDLELKSKNEKIYVNFIGTFKNCFPLLGLEMLSNGNIKSCPTQYLGG